jgi:hypothetical protein
MNTAKRTNQKIIGQGRDKFNWRKMERARDYSVLVEEEERKKKNKKERRNGKR